MNSQLIYQSKQLVASLTHALTAKNAETVRKQFCKKAQPCLIFPTKNLTYEGDEAIVRGLTEHIFDMGSHILYHLNSPAISRQASGYFGSYGVQGFCFSDKLTCFFDRFDIQFTEEAGQLKIQKLYWYTMLSFVPVAYKALYPENFSHFDDGPAAGRDDMQNHVGLQSHADTQILDNSKVLDDTHFLAQIASEYPAISNAISLYAHSRLFESPVAQWILDMPQIMDFTTDVLQEASSINIRMCGILLEETKSGNMTTTLSLIHVRLNRTDDCWQIDQWTSVPLAQLNESTLSPLTPPQAQAMIQRNRQESMPFSPRKKKSSGHVNDQCFTRTPELQEMIDIEQAAAQWVSAIRTCNPEPFYQTCLDRDNDDLLFDVIAPVKGIEGFFEQCRMMVRMDKMQPKKPGNHTLNTPYIVLSPAGDEAEAIWYDYGWTMMAEAFDITGPPYPALPALGRYRMRLINKNGQWKVFQFHWGPLFQHGAWQYDDQCTQGWTDTPLMIRWPELFETLDLKKDTTVNEFATNPIEKYLTDSVT